MILAVIAACEIAFWVALALGLVLRYPLHRPRLGIGVLAAIPAIDIALLVAVAINLNSGATATAAHSLATFYLGFSIAYGHRMITWTDERFAHRFAGGPAPRRLYGAAYARKCWVDVVRTGAACGLAAAITWGLITWIDDPSRTEALAGGYGWAALITGIELVIAISYTIWPRREKPAR